MDCLEEENNLLMKELISLLEGHTLRSQGTVQPCRTELVSLFDNCSIRDPIETSSEKWIWNYHAADLWAQLKRHKKTKIIVDLLDEKNHPLTWLDISVV